MDFKNKPILGMIHLSGADVITKVERALAEIDIYTNEGVDGIIVENYHGSIDDVEEVLKNLKDYRGYLGINILPNDFETALQLASQYNADFIQLDYVSGEYEPNTKLDEERLVKAVELSGSDTLILGGVWPKYYHPIAGSNMKKDVQNGALFCDAIVVTGSGTGKETPLDKIKLFREHLISSDRFRNTPLIIGAGLDASNVGEQLPFADGAIVGSCFKPYKRTQEMISPELVKEFMDEVKKVRLNNK